MNMTQRDREEDFLEGQLSEGLITVEEYNKQMKEIQRDYRDSLQERAWTAYEHVMLDE